MRIIPRRPATPPRNAAVVESWGPEPIGATQVEALQAATGAKLAGFTTPTPAGWGERGSVERTDNSVWASPQAFTAGGGQTAMSVFSTGAAPPTVYPQDAAMAQIALPGAGGI